MACTTVWSNMAMAFTAPYSTGMASSQPVAMAHREASAKKNSSISSVSSSHAPSMAQSTQLRPAQQAALSRKMNTLPTVSIPSPAMLWLRNCSVRVTGSACSRPTARVVIRYDHTAIAVRQPKSSAMTIEPNSAL